MALASVSKGTSFSRSINRSTEMSMSISAVLVLVVTLVRSVAHVRVVVLIGLVVAHLAVELDLHERLADPGVADLAGGSGHVELDSLRPGSGDAADHLGPVRQRHL